MCPHSYLCGGSSISQGLELNEMIADELANSRDKFITNKIIITCNYASKNGPEPDNAMLYSLTYQLQGMLQSVITVLQNVSIKHNFPLLLSRMNTTPKDRGVDAVF